MDVANESVRDRGRSPASGGGAGFARVVASVLLI